MIVVPICLDSAVTLKTTVLGTLVITNDGTGTKSRRNYDVKVYGKNAPIMGLRKVKPIRTGKIKNWRSEARPVFELVLEALRTTGYKGVDV